MRTDGNSPAQAKRFYTPPMKLKSAGANTWPSEKKQNSRSPSLPTMSDLFHVIHKVPFGDSPYVKAKHAQLIEKDPGKAVSLFWSAINAGDRVDSALKDMAVVMKQLDRSDEAIEAIKSFRHLCSLASQESLDNVLVELYKRSGRLGEQIQILQHKLKQVEEGNAFGGKRMKLARSQGKKVHITVEQEYARLLGNLAWAYLQENDYRTAEEYYRKALSIEVDRNKQCNLAVCLIYMNRIIEAKFLLQVIRDSAADGQMDESYAKSFERASQFLAEIESQPVLSSSEFEEKESRSEHTNFLAFTPYKKRYESIGNEWEANGIHSWKKTYTPPVPTKGLLPSCPFTQPRRASVLSDNGKWRKELSGNDPVNHSQRRLQFEKPADCKFLLPSGNPGRTLNVVPIEEEVNDKWGNMSGRDSSPYQLAVTASSGATSKVSGAQSEQELDQDFPVYKGKKSWADMAEEEEQKLMMMNGASGENVDMNKMGPSQNPQSLVDNLSSKFQSFAALDDQHSLVRRSLLFDQEQHEQQDMVKPKRSGRLKVFQDITPP